MKRSHYTQKERDFVFNNFKKLSINDICKNIDKSRRSLFSFLRMNKINIKDNWNLYDVQPSIFLNIKSPEVAYVLGFLWADGHLGNSNKILIDNKRSDVENIQNVFYKTGEWKVSFLNRENKSPSAQLYTINEILYNFLLENDYGAKSKKSPCKILNKIPDNIKKYFFRGWFDGDGSISKSKYYNISIAGSYSQDWSALENLSLKIFSKGRINKTKTKKGHKSSSFLLSGISAKRFLDYIYKDYDEIGLDRKYFIYKNKDNKKFGTNKYFGVMKLKNGTFQSKLTYGYKENKKQKYLGFFEDEKDAARAYDIALIEKNGLCGAKTNFPIEDYLD